VFTDRDTDTQLSCCSWQTTLKKLHLKHCSCSLQTTSISSHKWLRMLHLLMEATSWLY